MEWLNKWFKLALNSFVGIILINLLLGLFYGGGIGLNLGSLLVFSFNILYVLMIAGIIAGIGVLVKDALFSKE